MIALTMSIFGTIDFLIQLICDCDRGSAPLQEIIKLIFVDKSEDTTIALALISGLLFFQNSPRVVSRKGLLTAHTYQFEQPVLAHQFQGKDQGKDFSMLCSVK